MENMLDLAEFFLRLFLALVLGGLIGWEREIHDRPAGFRTHILVSLGSALLMLVSVNIAHFYPEGDGDPGRIAAQVVSGIGFLGAGTIIREGSSVKGLTTAASLWAMAAIGLAIGGGYYYLGIITTFLVFTTLYFFSMIEKKLEFEKRKRLVCRVVDHPGILGEIGTLLGAQNINIYNVYLDRDKDAGEIKLNFELILPKSTNLSAINTKLMEVDGFLEITWQDA